MEQEFFNMYVERLINEMTELTKMKILLETKVLFTEKINKTLATKVSDLEKKLEEFKDEAKVKENSKSF